MITLNDVFQAYYDCRKNKRNTHNALHFEMDYEARLIQLHKEIISKTYKVGRSIAFVVNKPVTREVFAGDFRDRVVHHLVINKTLHLFEKEFIYDTYSCRKGKGVMFGIDRAAKFMRQASDNYQKPAYVMKLDISGFFMNIDKNILFGKLKTFLLEKYSDDDLDILLYLVKEIIYNDCTKNCLIKGKQSDWKNIPNHKSLFQKSKEKWQPIGNLTSQIFGNFYLNTLDHFIKSSLKMRFYGRYVDDMIFISANKSKLQIIQKEINIFLQRELQLRLNLKKTYIATIQKGTSFLGMKIYPHRLIIWERIKNDFKYAVYRINQLLSYKIEKDYRSSINAYLWLICHYPSYIFRKKIAQICTKIFYYSFFFVRKYSKINQRMTFCNA